MPNKILFFALTILTSNTFAQVGIGTNIPTEQFHTTLGVRFEGITQSDSLSRILAQDQTGKLFWKSPSSLDNTFWSLKGNAIASLPGSFIGTTDNTNLVFKTANTTRATFLANGNLGLGYTAPQAKLVIYNTNADNHLWVTGVTPSMVMFDSPNNPTMIAKLGLATNANNFVAGSIPGDYVLQTLGNNNNLIFGVGDNGSNGIERARLNKNGFGIATNNPSATLHVNGTVKFENLPSGAGNVLVIDAAGNIFKSIALASSANRNINTTEMNEKIEALEAKVNSLQLLVNSLTKN